MQKFDEEEFNESDLYNNDAHDEQAHDSSEEEDASVYRVQEDQDSAAPAGTCIDIGSRGEPGTTLEDINEEEVVEALPRDATRPKGRNAFAGAYSLQPAAAVRMGSSVPISIPALPFRAASRLASADTEQQYPGTFIPPHQLSQQDGFIFSLTGTAISPRGAIKRDRLRVRTAILQSTGFLEKQEVAPSTAGMQEHTRLANLTGGLSQALHATTPGFPAGA